MSDASIERGGRKDGALRRLGLRALWALAVFAAAPFALYAAVFGLRGLSADLSEASYLFERGSWLTNGALALHMIGGAVITILALTQVVGPLRRRWPGLHRASGYVFVVCAVASALGGLFFIAWRGTIGGPLMDVAFALYGVLTLTAAAQAARLARRRDFAAHRRWALRAAVLALGSWIYRVHYTVWHVAADGVGSEPDFSGLFDQITMFAFYLPYLLALELFLWRERRPHGPARR